MDVDSFWDHVDGGQISSVWLTEGGIEGGIQLAPIEAMEAMLTPFFVNIPDGDLPDIVTRLRSEGVVVDASWEIARLRGLAI